MEEIDKIKTEIPEDICDIEADFYRRQLAIGTYAGNLYIYNNLNEKPSKIVEIPAHIGPIYKISWSHPSFGPVIGTCGFDKKVNFYILNERNNQLEKIYDYEMHDNSVKCLKFCGSSDELILISGCLNGDIVICKYLDKNFILEKVNAHNFGVNSIDFFDNKTFVTCGNDNTIKIWNFSLENGKITVKNEKTLKDNSTTNITDVSVKDNKHFVCCGESDEGGIVNYWILNEENKWEPHEIYRENVKIEKIRFNDDHTCIAVIDSEGKEHLILENELNL